MPQARFASLSPIAARTPVGQALAPGIARRRGASRPAAGPGLGADGAGQARGSGTAPRRPPPRPRRRSPWWPPPKARLKPEPAPETETWAFDGKSLAPTLRVKLGESVRLRVENRTPAAALAALARRAQPEPDGRRRGPHAGADRAGRELHLRLHAARCRHFPGQAPRGRGFQRALRRGLAGSPRRRGEGPPAVDRDIALLMQDWRLQEDGSLAAVRPDGLRGGGRAPRQSRDGQRASGARGDRGPPGVRLRLRLGNACNARATRIRFDGLKVYVAGVDGQPTDTFEPLRATPALPARHPLRPSPRHSRRGGGEGQHHGPRGQRPRPGDPDHEGRTRHRERPPIGPIGDNRSCCRPR